MDLNKLAPYMEVEQALARLIGNEELLMTILGLMLDDFRSEKDAFAELIKQGSVKDVADKAHYYKGIAANLNVVNVLKITQGIELDSRKEKWPEVETSFQELCIEMEGLNKVFLELKSS